MTITTQMSTIHQPEVSERDAAKVGRYINLAEAAIGRARHGTVRTSRELADAIERLGKLSPDALDGGQDLIDEVTGILWSAYAKCEAVGLDDAHYLQSDIPCDDRQRGLLEYQPRKRWNGEQSHGLPVSPRLRAREMAQAAIHEGIEAADLVGYQLDVMQPGQVKRAWTRPYATECDMRLEREYLKLYSLFK